MSVTIPIVAADGTQSTITLGTPSVSSSGPSGTMETISAQATSDYDYPPGSAYQPANSPWWIFDNAETKVQGTLEIQYYPNNFPDYTTILWSSPAFSYPELIIGAQGPNHDPSAGGPVYGPAGTKGAPSWVGKELNTFSSMVFSWNITLGANNNNGFDLLAETFLGPSGGESAGQGGPNYETCLVLKDPGWWTGKTKYEAVIGGVAYYFIPGGEPTSTTKSLDIIPVSVWNNGSGSGVPLLGGTVDLWPLLSYAASQGWTSMDYCLYGWEVGPEVGNNSGMTGSLTFNSLSFTVS